MWRPIPPIREEPRNRFRYIVMSFIPIHAAQSKQKENRVSPSLSAPCAGCQLVAEAEGHPSLRLRVVMTYLIVSQGSQA